MLTRRVALSSAVLPRVHPPQLKPMTTVARKPAKAPRARRLSDSPFSIAGNSMWFPFARGVSVRGYGHPDGFRSISWIEGPVGLRRRLDQNKCAPIGDRSLYKIDHPAVGDWRGLSPKALRRGPPTPAGTRFGDGLPSRPSRSPSTPSSSQRSRYRPNCRSDTPATPQPPSSKVSPHPSGSTQRETSASCGLVATPSGSSIRPLTGAQNRTTRVLPNPDNSCAYDTTENRF